MFTRKTYWIVGASEGLGRALAKALHAEGARLILSARNGDRLSELADEIGNADVVPMDVTDAQSVAHAAKSAGFVVGTKFENSNNNNHGTIYQAFVAVDIDDPKCRYLGRTRR